MNEAIKHMLYRYYRFLIRPLGRTGLVRHAFLHRLNRRLAACFRPTSVVVDGHTMLLDDTDSLALTSGPYLPYTTRLITRLLQPGATAIDGGAHIGHFTLAFARAVGSTGRVHAFEPEPRNCSLLRKNIALNGYENVIVVERALSDAGGVATLYCSDCSALHRLHPSGMHSGTRTVETVRLDDCLNRDTPVDLVKLDIEGSEFAAFRGMTECLRRNSGCKLVFEFCPTWLCEAGADPRELLVFLQAMGFRFFDIRESETKTQPVDATSLMALYGRVAMSGTNVLALRDG